MSTKRLFHLSYGLRRIEQFIPRVPRDRLDEEDATTPRICLTAGIDDCLSASPMTSEIFDEDGSIACHEISHYRYDRDEHDTEFGVPFVLYVFDVPVDAVRFPTDLVDLVPDALDNQEYWAMCPLTPVATYFFLLYEVNPDGGMTFYHEIPESDFKQLVPVDENFNDCVAPFDERPFSRPYGAE